MSRNRQRITHSCGALTTSLTYPETLQLLTVLSATAKKSTELEFIERDVRPFVRSSYSGVPRSWKGRKVLTAARLSGISKNIIRRTPTTSEFTILDLDLGLGHASVTLQAGTVVYRLGYLMRRMRLGKRNPPHSGRIQYIKHFGSGLKAPPYTTTIVPTRRWTRKARIGR